MSPLQTIKSSLLLTFKWAGRASRPEFIWFGLFWLVAPQVAGFVIAFPFGVAQGYASQQAGNYQLVQTPSPFAAIATYTLMALLFVPLVSVASRRLHDLGLSSYYILLPVLAWIVSMICLTLFFLLSGLSSFEAGHKVGSLWERTTLFILLSSALYLSRPSQPGPNKYGPNPQEVTS